MNATSLLHDVTGQGEPIVLVPGGLSGWLSWIPHAELLSTDHKVVRVQLRSVEIAEAGQAYPPDYGVKTERDALLATVDQLGLATIDLVGWSHGGGIALAFALEYPERVRSLTLIEPQAPWILKQTGKAVDELADAQKFERCVAGKEITVDDLKGFIVRAGLGRPGGDFESLPGWPVWVRNRQVLSIIYTLVEFEDSLDRLRALNVPVLGVRGTDTSVVDAAIVEQLVGNVPDGRLLELPGDHAAHLQNFERFLEALSAHINYAAAKSRDRETSHA